MGGTAGQQRQQQQRLRRGKAPANGGGGGGGGSDCAANSHACGRPSAASSCHERNFASSCHERNFATARCRAGWVWICNSEVIARIDMQAYMWEDVSLRAF